MVACLPDLDLVLHLFAGPQHHRGPSHSFGLALLCGVAVFALASLKLAHGPAARLGLLACAAWASHVVLDWLGSDSRLPLGIMALWPASDAFYVAPFPLFMDVGREVSLATLRHNIVAMAWEIVLLAPLLLWARRARHAAY